MTVVHVPSPLFSYTGGRAEIEGTGATMADVLDDLETRYPGLRFRIVDEQDRIRPTIFFTVNGRVVREISQPLSLGDDVRIVAALSGG